MPENMIEAVAAIKNRIATFDAGSLRTGRFRGSPHTALVLHLDLNWLTSQFVSVVGSDKILSFFEGHEPRFSEAGHHLTIFMHGMIESCCIFTPSWSVLFDEEKAVRKLTEMHDAVASGRMRISLRMKVVNVSVSSDFKLSDDLWFRRMPSSEVPSTYRLDDGVMSQFSNDMLKSWPEHNAEVVITRDATAADLQRMLSLEEQEALANPVNFAFLIADLPVKGSPAQVSHILLESPIQCVNIFIGMRSFSFRPHELTLQEIGELKKAYGFVQALGQDRVLEAAVDRFVLGMKRSSNHANRLNEPNWDKLVDYVIAMETLFLAGTGNTELSYRFRLNGSSLLSRSLGRDVRDVFHALKFLYELRSKVVHGDHNKAIEKAAKKFVEHLSIKKASHDHGIGLLSLISSEVESWLRASFFYLSALEVKDRPYVAVDGWEELLWGSQVAAPVES